MAICTECGGKAGFLMNMCDACIAKQNAAAAQRPTAPAARPKLALNKITTNPTLPMIDITENLGIVRGISVRSRSVVGNFTAGVESIVGGQIASMEKLCEDTRRIAFDRLRENAAAIGADAVVGLRYDANEVFDGITEVLCYGTAVRAPNKETH